MSEEADIARSESTEVIMAEVQRNSDADRKNRNMKKSNSYTAKLNNHTHVLSLFPPIKRYFSFTLKKTY